MSEMHPPEQPAPDSHALFQRYLSQINKALAKVRRCQHMTEDEFDDFRGDIHLRLLENDCAVLREYRGQAGLVTYLVGVMTNHLRNRRNKLWGKWRPCRASEQAGPHAVLLEQLIVRDGLSHAAARRRLENERGVCLDDAEFDRLVALFVGKNRRHETDPAVLEETAAALPDPEAQMLADENAVHRATLNQVLRQALRRLTKQERLWLRLRYASGLKIKSIAKSMNLTPRSLYSRFEQLNRRLRGSLEAAGFSQKDVIQVIDEAGYHLNIPPQDEIFDPELSGEDEEVLGPERVCP